MTLFLAACAMAVTVNIKPAVDADAVLVWAITEKEQGPRNNPTNMTRAAGWPRKTPHQRIEEIRSELVSHGEKPTPYNIALCWNAGVTAFMRRKLLPRHWDYADCVFQLYHQRMAALSK